MAEKIQRKKGGLGEEEEFIIDRDASTGRFTTDGEPKAKTIGIRVTASDYAIAKELAREEGISPTKWAERIVEAAIARHRAEREKFPLDDGEGRAES